MASCLLLIWLDKWYGDMTLMQRKSQFMQVHMVQQDIAQMCWRHQLLCIIPMG